MNPSTDSPADNQSSLNEKMQEYQTVTSAEELNEASEVSNFLVYVLHV